MLGVLGLRSRDPQRPIWSSPDYGSGRPGCGTALISGCAPSIGPCRHVLNGHMVKVGSGQSLADPTTSAVRTCQPDPPMPLPSIVFGIGGVG